MARSRHATSRPPVEDVWGARGRRRPARLCCARSCCAGRPARNPAELSVVSALATAETVEHVTSLDARIKWPNDVLLGDRKVAGILLEGRPSTIVLGIGLNVNQTEAQLPDRPQFPAGSLFTSDGNRRERAPILAELLVRVELLYERWANEGLASLLPDIARRDALRGSELEIGALRGTSGRHRGGRRARARDGRGAAPGLDRGGDAHRLSAGRPVDRPLVKLEADRPVRLLRALLLLLAPIGLALVLAGPAVGQEQPRVLAIDFENDVNPVTADYVIDEIERAEQDGYDAVAILLDTPGGLAEAMRDIYKRMLESPLPIIVYVSPDGARAASAGVWIVPGGRRRRHGPADEHRLLDADLGRRRGHPGRPAPQGRQRRRRLPPGARGDSRSQRRVGRAGGPPGVEPDGE